jgi:hypothetical protein
MARQVIEWDNWISHDLGRRAPQAYHYGRRKLSASYSHWRGLNVVRYLNGSIGPRPPFATVTRLPNSPPSQPWGGSIVAALWVGGLRQVCLIMSNGDVWHAGDFSTEPGNITWVFFGNLGFVPSVACVNGLGVMVGSLTVQSGGNPNTCFAAFVDIANNVITPITGMPICNLMVSYQQFIVVGNTLFSSGNTSTLFFSDLPANINDTPGLSWTAAQANGVGVVGIGTAEPVSGLFTQKDTLVIPKQGGEWYTLTGIPSGPPIIRRIDVGLDFRGVGGPVRQSNIWYPNGRDIGVFTGSAVQVDDLPDYDDLGSTSKYDYNHLTGLCQLSQADEFLLMGTALNDVGDQVVWAFIRHGLAGVATSTGWSRHVLQYEPNHTVQAPTPIPVYVGDSVAWIFLQAAADHPVDVFQFDIRQEIPYQKTWDTGANFPHGNPEALYADAQAGTVVNGFLSIPEWWSPDGHNAQVHEIFVDLDYDGAAWQNASDAGIDPSRVVGFDVTVDALNLKGADNSRSSFALPWGPPDIVRPVPTSNTNMIRTRAYLRVGDQGASSGFRINLTNMRGVQVYRILATVDVSVSEP